MAKPVNKVDSHHVAIVEDYDRLDENGNPHVYRVPVRLFEQLKHAVYGIKRVENQLTDCRDGLVMSRNIVLPC
jgi:hypothetical protein